MPKALNRKSFLVRFDYTYDLMTSWYVQMKCNVFAGVLSEMSCNQNKKGGSSYMKEYNCSYTTRIGKTTFIVNVKQSETAQKPLNKGHWKTSISS